MNSDVDRETVFKVTAKLQAERALADDLAAVLINVVAYFDQLQGSSDDLRDIEAVLARYRGGETVTRDEADDYLDRNYGGELMHDDPEWWQIMVESLMETGLMPGDRYREERR